jgi:peptide/nickel transport system ATP-binding protein
VLQVEGVRKWFPVGQGVLEALARRDREYVRAVDGVSVGVEEGEIVGIAGESGSGKSTLGEIMVGLQRPTSGRVLWHGSDIARLRGGGYRAFRTQAQMVFQDPYGTLNSRFTIYQSVAEPVIVAGVSDRAERLAKVRTALARCELEPNDELLNAFPHQLSGGQRQRVAIARAIVMQPRLLVADEPVSMLDASVRSGILNLFLSLRKELNLGIVYISHDLASVHYLCDRIAIMYLGTVVEAGAVETVVEAARHPYTRALLLSTPRMDLDVERGRPPVGDAPMDSIRVAAACRFAPRCPYVADDCRAAEPALEQVAPGHDVRCVRPRAEPLWEGSPTAL